jgi:hypothetical protein
MINSCPALRSFLSGYRKPLTIVPSAMLIPCTNRPEARGRVQRYRFSGDQSFHSMPEPLYRNPLTMIHPCPALRSSLSGYRKPLTIVPSTMLIPCYNRPEAGPRSPNAREALPRPFILRDRKLHRHFPWHAEVPPLRDEGGFSSLAVLTNTGNPAYPTTRPSSRITQPGSPHLECFPAS